MKRLLAAALVLCLCMSLAACDGLDYVKAMKFYEEGQYAEALAIYNTLGDYADSATMRDICQNIVDYTQAEAYYAAGDYRAALELYQAHERYEDSAAKSLICRYNIGLECIETGEYEEALTWLEAMGGYEESPQHVERARWLWLYSYLDENGPVTVALDQENTETVALSAGEDEALCITYSREGYLLGMPYSDTFTMTLVRGEETAAYTAMSVSSSVNRIQENVSGTVTLAGFTAGSKLEMESYRKAVTDAEGEQTFTEDQSEALMIKTALQLAQTAISGNLSAMIEQTGVAITVRNLGFRAFE